MWPSLGKKVILQTAGRALQSEPKCTLAGTDHHWLGPGLMHAAQLSSEGVTDIGRIRPSSLSDCEYITMRNLYGLAFFLGGG